MTNSRILVAHDDPEQVGRIKRILECARFDMSAAACSHEETAMMAERCQPDLVLMDVPHNRADEVLKSMKRIAKRFDTPVLCMAECDDHEFLERSTSREPIVCLPKPYEDMELLFSVTTAIRYQASIRWRLQEMARAQDGWLYGAFEHAPIGKALVGLDGRILKVNRALWELTGLSERELTRKTFQDVFIPDEGSVHVDPLRFLVRGEQRVYQAEGLCRHRLGYDLKVLFNFSLGDHVPGSARHIILQVMDITKQKSAEKELQESEQRYRKLVEATTSYIYTVTVRDGRPVSTRHEQGCVLVTGYTAEEYEADPHLWYRMVYEDDRKDVIRQAELVLSGKNVSALEHRIIHKNGSLRWVRNTPVPHYDGQGRVVSYDGLVTCVTNERRLKDQLHQAQKMEAVGQLAGGIAHDFNNILTAIIGYGTLLSMRMTEEDPLRTEVDQILKATERAAKLTERLLAFSRKQSNKPAPERINEVVQGVGKLLSRVLGEDIELKYHFSESDDMVMADIWQLEQVLLNLATNARDAMPSGGSLSIETGKTWLNGDFIRMHEYGEVGLYAYMAVTDTGTGMDEETQKRIYEPFFTTKEVGKGTGLGLAITYGIVKQHRGFITVYSQPGIGTTFKIYLPVITDDAAATEGAASMVHVQGRETVLLAEDDDEARVSTKALLENYGYKVIDAAEGDEAVVKFIEHRDVVDIVVLDVLMPKKNGKEVYDEIRKVKPGIRALFTSGYTEELIRQKGILNHEVNFITKPLSPAAFSKKIREVLAA